jgi:hypothetical protein
VIETNSSECTPVITRGVAKEEKGNINRKMGKKIKEKPKKENRSEKGVRAINMAQTVV